MNLMTQENSSGTVQSFDKSVESSQGSVGKSNKKPFLSSSKKELAQASYYTPGKIFLKRFRSGILQFSTSHGEQQSNAKIKKKPGSNTIRHKGDFRTEQGRLLLYAREREIPEEETAILRLRSGTSRSCGKK